MGGDDGGAGLRGHREVVGVGEPADVVADHRAGLVGGLGHRRPPRVGRQRDVEAGAQRLDGGDHPVELLVLASPRGPARPSPRRRRGCRRPRRPACSARREEPVHLEERALVVERVGRPVEDAHHQGARREVVAPVAEQSRIGHRRRTRRTPARRSVRTGGGERGGTGRAGVVGPDHLEQVDELLAGGVVVLDPSQQRVELGVDARRPRRPSSPVRARAATWRVSGVSGMRASRASASSLTPRRPCRRAARPGRRWPRRGRARARGPAAATPRRPTATSWSASLGAGARLVDPLADLGLGQGADEPVDDLPVLDGEHGRDGLDLEGGRHLRVLVDVDLDQLDAVAGLVDDLLQDGPSVRHGPHHGAHRSTTTGDLSGALEHGGLEGGVGDVHQAITGTANARSRARLRHVRALRCVAPIGGADRDGHRRRARCPSGSTPMSDRAPSAPTGSTSIAGGRSNLTFRVTDAAGRRCVLRRPPISHVLPTAHDMGREHRIIPLSGPPACRSLPRSGCARRGQRPAVLRHGLRRRARPARRRHRGPRAHTGRQRGSRSSISSTCWPASTPSTSTPSGSATSAGGRATSSVSSSAGTASSSSRPPLQGRTVPGVDEVHDLLASRIPPQGRAAIVHGDYRLDNSMRRRRRRGARPSSTGSCAPSAIPSPTSGLLMVYWPSRATRSYPSGARADRWPRGS